MSSEISSKYFNSPIKSDTKFSKVISTVKDRTLVAIIIDSNADGRLNTKGSSYGDTIKLFDFNTGKAAGFHLVKRGEVGEGRAGSFSESEVKLEHSLKKTFNKLTTKEIMRKCPSANHIDRNKNGIFDEGDSLNLTSIDGNSLHKIYYVKSGDCPGEIAHKGGVSDTKDLKGTLQAGSFVWTTVETNQE